MFQRCRYDSSSSPGSTPVSHHRSLSQKKQCRQQSLRFQKLPPFRENCLAAICRRAWSLEQMRILLRIEESCSKAVEVYSPTIPERYLVARLGKYTAENACQPNQQPRRTWTHALRLNALSDHQPLPIMLECRDSAGNTLKAACTSRKRISCRTA